MLWRFSGSHNRYHSALDHYQILNRVSPDNHHWSCSRKRENAIPNSNLAKPHVIIVGNGSWFNDVITQLLAQRTNLLISHTIFSDEITFLKETIIFCKTLHQPSLRPQLYLLKTHQAIDVLGEFFLNIYSDKVGLVYLALGSWKSLDSTHPRSIFLVWLWRLLEAMSIIQIKADTNAPITKYAVIKIVIIVTNSPFALTVRCLK